MKIDKSINLDEMKKIELNMLIYLDKICDKNNINYSLTGGTLLGAVRHKGFIPWDDDIDVFMTRSNYNKFINVFKKYKNNRFSLLNVNTQKDYYYLFSKIIDNKTSMTENNTKKINNLGVYVDIFPIDNVPDDLNERARFLKKINKIRKLLDLTCNINYKNKSKINIFLRKTIFFATSSRLSNFLAKKIDSLCQKYVGFNTINQTTIFGSYGIKEIMNKKIYNEYNKIEFENHFFQCTSYCNFYLKNIYGDYMKLPPKEKRVSHHNYIAKWKK